MQFSIAVLWSCLCVSATGMASNFDQLDSSPMINIEDPYEILTMRDCADEPYLSALKCGHSSIPYDWSNMRGAIIAGSTPNILKMLNDDDFQPEPEIMNEWASLAIEAGKYSTAQFLVSHIKFKPAPNYIYLLFQAVNNGLNYIVCSLLTRSDFVELVKFGGDNKKSQLFIDELNRLLCLALSLKNKTVALCILDYPGFKPNNEFEVALEKAASYGYLGVLAKMFTHDFVSKFTVFLILRVAINNSRSLIGAYIVRHPKCEQIDYPRKYLEDSAKNNLVQTVIALIDKDQHKVTNGYLDYLLDICISKERMETALAIIDHPKYHISPRVNNFLRQAQNLELDAISIALFKKLIKEQRTPIRVNYEFGALLFKAALADGTPTIIVEQVAQAKPIEPLPYGVLQIIPAAIQEYANFTEEDDTDVLIMEITNEQGQTSKVILEHPTYQYTPPSVPE